jgi:photosystem I subunit VIII
MTLGPLCFKSFRGRTYNTFESFVPNSVRSFEMAASFLPSIFVPLTGIVMPAVVMALLFTYIESGKN